MPCRECDELKNEIRYLWANEIPLWMPIETFPCEDGDEALLADGDDVLVGWRADGRFNAFGYQGDGQFTPTHWMFLPEPPNA